MTAIHEGPFQNITAIPSSVSFWLWPVDKTAPNGWGYPWGDGATPDPETGEPIPVYGTAGGPAPYAVMSPKKNGSHKVSRWPDLQTQDIPIVTSNAYSAGNRYTMTPDGPVSWIVDNGDLVWDPYFHGVNYNNACIYYKGSKLYDGSMVGLAAAYCKGFLFVVEYHSSGVTVLAGEWQQRSTTLTSIADFASTDIPGTFDLSYNNHYQSPWTVSEDGTKASIVLWNIADLTMSGGNDGVLPTCVVTLSFDVQETPGEEGEPPVRTPVVSIASVDITQDGIAVEVQTHSQTPESEWYSPSSRPDTIGGWHYRAGAGADTVNGSSYAATAQAWSTAHWTGEPVSSVGAEVEVAATYRYYADVVLESGSFVRVYKEKQYFPGHATAQMNVAYNGVGTVARGRQIVGLRYIGNVLYGLYIESDGYSASGTHLHSKDSWYYYGDYDEYTDMPEPVAGCTSSIAYDERYTLSPVLTKQPVFGGAKSTVMSLGTFHYERTCSIGAYSEKVSSSTYSNSGGASWRTKESSTYRRLQNVDLMADVYIYTEADFYEERSTSATFKAGPAQVCYDYPSVPVTPTSSSDVMDVAISPTVVRKNLKFKVRVGSLDIAVASSSNNTLSDTGDPFYRNLYIKDEAYYVPVRYWPLFSWVWTGHFGPREGTCGSVSFTSNGTTWFAYSMLFSGVLYGPPNYYYNVDVRGIGYTYNGETFIVSLPAALGVPSMDMNYLSTSGVSSTIYGDWSSFRHVGVV